MCQIKETTVGQSVYVPSPLMLTHQKNIKNTHIHTQSHFCHFPPWHKEQEIHSRWKLMLSVFLCVCFWCWVCVWCWVCRGVIFKNFVSNSLIESVINHRLKIKSSYHDRWICVINPHLIKHLNTLCEWLRIWTQSFSSWPTGCLSSESDEALFTSSSVVLTQRLIRLDEVLFTSLFASLLLVFDQVSWGVRWQRRLCKDFLKS